MTNLSIRKRQTRGVLILDLEGEINLFSSPELRTEILAAFKDSALPILVNFSRVTHIDSSGLATVIEGLQQARKTQRKYVLFGLDDRVRSVFEVSKLTGAFSIYADEASALDALCSVKTGEIG